MSGTASSKYVGHIFQEYEYKTYIMEEQEKEMQYYSSRAGNRDKDDTLAFLMKRVNKTKLKGLVDDAITNKTLFKLCNLRNISERDMTDLLKNGILTSEDVVANAGRISSTLKKALFAYSPSDHTYELIKDLRLTKEDMELFVNSKSLTKMDKYGIKKVLTPYAWSEYVIAGRRYQHKRLVEFKEAFPDLRNKSEVRRMLVRCPCMLGVLSVEDLQKCPVTAKEFISFLNRELDDADRYKYVSTPVVDWLEQEVFLETLDGTSSISKPLQKNLDELRAICVEKDMENMSAVELDEYMVNKNEEGDC